MSFIGDYLRDTISDAKSVAKDVAKGFNWVASALRRDPEVYAYPGFAYTVAVTLREDFGIEVKPIGISEEITSVERACVRQGKLPPKGNPAVSGWMYFAFDDKLSKFGKLPAAVKSMQYIYGTPLTYHPGAAPEPGLFILQDRKSDFAIEVPIDYLNRVSR